MLKPKAQAQVEPFLKALAESSKRLLMLDYDGTLAPFRTERHQAFPYPEVTAVLQEIIRDSRTRVVIVSGREINELIPLLGIDPPPELWGVHGLQRRWLNGTATSEVEQRYLEALTDARRWLEYQHLIPRAEFKTGSIAVHWRGQTSLEAAEIRGRVLAGWRPISELGGMTLFEFDGGIEIRAPGADKGDVVRILLQEMGAGVVAAYLGDDATDESAFRAIGGRGLGILARPERRRTAAQLWLQPPDEVFDFLSQWLEFCRSSDTDRDATAGAVCR